MLTVVSVSGPPSDPVGLRNIIKKTGFQGLERKKEERSNGRYRQAEKGGRSTPQPQLLGRQTANLEALEHSVRA